MLTLLLATLSRAEAGFCIALNSNKAECPNGYEWKDAASPVTVAGKRNLHVIDSSTVKVLISAELTVVGKSVGVNMKIDALPYALTMALSNIKISTDSNVLKLAKLTINGEVSIGDLDLGVSELIVNTVQKMSSELIVRINGLAKKVQIASEDITKSVSIGNRRITLTKEGSEYGISIRSKYSSSVSFDIDQSKGKLLIKKYGNPVAKELFKITINAAGGIIDFADQTWKNTRNALSDWLPFLNQPFILLEQKAKSEIHISGRDIPLNIKNSCEQALKIICDKQSVGIQGTVTFKNAIDEIAANVDGLLEFSAGKLEGAAKAIINSKIAVSLPKEFFAQIAESITKLCKDIAAKLESITEKTMKLATNAIVSAQIAFDSATKKIQNGFVTVTDDFEMPRVGKASFVLNGSDITTTFDFSALKNMITEPITVFCSAKPFDCDKWDVSISSSKEMPKLESSCQQKDGKQCLQVRLSQLPEWIPEKYCLATSNNCPDGYVKITPENIPTIAKSVHEKTKQIKLDIQEAIATGAELKIGDFATLNAALEVKGSSTHPALKLNVAGGNQKTASLSLSGLGLEFQAATPTSEVEIAIPKVDIRDIILNTNSKDLVFKFSNNDVNIDLDSFKKFVNAKYNDLTVAFDKVVNTIEVKQAEWEVKMDQISEKIQQASVNGVFTTDVKINKQLTLSINAATSINGIGISINAESTNPNVQFDASWDGVVGFGKGIQIKSDISAKITDLPGKASIEISGGGNLDISTKGASVNVVGNTEINGNKKIKVNAGSSINIENLSFTGSGDFDVVGASDNAIIAAAGSLSAAANVDVNAKQIEIKGAMKLEAGAKVNIEKLILAQKKAASRTALETPQELIFRYKFQDNGFPMSTISKFEGAPSKIRVIYAPTLEENSKTQFNEWVENPQTIILAGMTKQTCESMKNIVSFESEIEGTNPTMKAFCDPDADYRESKDEQFMALQVMLTSPPPADESNSGLSNGAIAGIVIASIAIVAIICGIAFYFYTNKKSDNT